MQFYRGKELQPFPSLYSPFLQFFICQPSIGSLPSLSLPSPSLSTSPFSFLPLLLPFPVPSVVPYIPHSLSTFPFPSQSSPFSPNLPRPYFSSSLPISFPTYLLPYLSTSLSSPSLHSRSLDFSVSFRITHVGLLIPSPPSPVLWISVSFHIHVTCPATYPPPTPVLWIC